MDSHDDMQANVRKALERSRANAVPLPILQKQAGSKPAVAVPPGKKIYNVNSREGVADRVDRQITPLGLSAPGPAKLPASPAEQAVVKGQGLAKYGEAQPVQWVNVPQVPIPPPPPGAPPFLEILQALTVENDSLRVQNAQIEVLTAENESLKIKYLAKIRDMQKDYEAYLDVHVQNLRLLQENEQLKKEVADLKGVRIAPGFVVGSELSFDPDSDSRIRGFVCQVNAMKSVIKNQQAQIQALSTSLPGYAEDEGESVMEVYEDTRETFSTVSSSLLAGFERLGFSE